MILDRIFGLTALITMMGVACGLFWEDLIALSPQLVLANMGLFLCFLLFSLLFLSPVRIGFRSNRFLRHLWFIRNHRATVVYCLLISILCQGASLLTFWLLSYPYFPPQFSLINLLTIFPIGIVATSLPITPLGLGVGHVLFEQLFELYGVAGGANYFNAYVFTNIVHRVLGVVPYLGVRFRGGRQSEVWVKSISISHSVWPVVDCS